MPVQAPYQLWIDGVTIKSGTRTGSTVTITTESAHALTTGTYVEVGGAGTTGAALGMNGIYPITVTNGTQFTYTSAGTAGTGIPGNVIGLTSEYYSFDVMNPLINYSTADRSTALYINLQSVKMSMTGDGEASMFMFKINQDDATATPWYLAIPDNSRIRLIKAKTGESYISGQTMFRGFITEMSSELIGSNLGASVDVTCMDVNGLFDRVVVYGTLGANYGRPVVI